MDLRRLQKKWNFFQTQLKNWGFDPLPAFSELPGVSLEYPLLATSCKNSNFFHSAHRQISSLRKKHPEPIVEIHPAAARILDLIEGDWARIITPKGRIEQKVHLSESWIRGLFFWITVGGFLKRGFRPFLTGTGPISIS